MAAREPYLFDGLSGGRSAGPQRSRELGAVLVDGKKLCTAALVDVDAEAQIGSVSARAAFVIDKSGVIQYAEQTPTPKDLPNFDALKARLAELR